MDLTKQHLDNMNPEEIEDFLEIGVPASELDASLWFLPRTTQIEEMDMEDFFGNPQKDQQVEEESMDLFQDASDEPVSETLWTPPSFAPPAPAHMIYSDPRDLPSQVCQSPGEEEREKVVEVPVSTCGTTDKSNAEQIEKRLRPARTYYSSPPESMNARAIRKVLKERRLKNSLGGGSKPIQNGGQPSKGKDQGASPTATSYIRLQGASSNIANALATACVPRPVGQFATRELQLLARTPGIKAKGVYNTKRPLTAVKIVEAPTQGFGSLGNSTSSLQTDARKQGTLRKDQLPSGKHSSTATGRSLSSNVESTMTQGSIQGLNDKAFPRPDNILSKNDLPGPSQRLTDKALPGPSRGLIEQPIAGPSRQMYSQSHSGILPKRQAITTFSHHRTGLRCENLQEAFQGYNDLGVGPYYGSPTERVAPQKELRYPAAGDPWEAVLYLRKRKRLRISWKLLKQIQGPPGGDCRTFRFEIRLHDKYFGVCEARKEYQAKHGAAVHFLQQIAPTLPYNNLPTQVDDAVLMNSATIPKFFEQLRLRFGKDAHDRCRWGCQMEKVGRRIRFESVLTFNGRDYRGYSYGKKGLARYGAVRDLCEKLFNQRCVSDDIFLGGQCSDGNNYKVVKALLPETYVEYPEGREEQHEQPRQ